MKARHLGLLCGLSLTACNEPVALLPDNVEIRVENPIGWPGGDLVLVSEAFDRYPELPLVLLDSQSLTLSRMNDSTIHARLPDSSGNYDLTVWMRGVARTGTIRIAGYMGRRTGPQLFGWGLAIEPGAPVVIGGGADSLIRLDLRNGHWVSLPVMHRSQCLLSPGPSFRAGSVVAGGTATSCNVAKSWKVEPGVVIRDSVPSGGNYLRAELAAGLWLNAGHHAISLKSATQGFWTIQMEEVERLVLSPGGELAVPLAVNAEAGQVDMPVFSTALRAIAYRVPLRQMQAAAFSSDGDTLFASGSRLVAGEWQARTVAVSAPTGQVLLDVRNDTISQPWDLIVDPAAPLLYAVTLQRLGYSWAPIVHVLDRGTLQRIATLRPPANEVCEFAFCGQVTLGMDRTTSRLFALNVLNWGLNGIFGASPSDIWEMDLVPTNQQPVVLSR